MNRDGQDKPSHDREPTGRVVIKRDNFTLYFPLMTRILLSVLWL